MDTEGLSRLDTYPYRHRVGEVMGCPPVTCAATASLTQAAQVMAARQVSAVIVVEAGTPAAAAGIVTERDLLRAVADGGGFDRPVSALMSQPVETVAPDDFIYVALARMDRLGIRHLAVTDPAGGLVGVVSARALLKLRARGALVIGDEITAAGDAAALASAISRLPVLARGLREEGVTGRDIARVISGVMRDATARAAALAEAALRAEGRGGPPAACAVLVLGSAGRGESLLVPDQDNAIVHAGSDRDDPWFADLGRRLCDTLDHAGIPYCRGGVMACEPAWRRPLDGWREAVGHWIGVSTPRDLLNVDIFYDLRAVWGEPALVDALAADAIAAARHARGFLRLLAANLETMPGQFGLFGRLITEAGRIDLKRGGLLPIVTAARIMALKCGSAALSTPERLAAAVAAGGLTDTDRAALDAAHAVLLDLILDQQLADLAAGVAPSTRVAPARLDRPARRQLKHALRQVELARDAVRDVLTSAG